MRPPLDFDDAGARDDEPAKNVTIGDIRAWHDEIDMLTHELARVRKAHRSIMNEILYGGTDLSDEPDIDRIHDFAKVGLKNMRPDYLHETGEEE